VAAEGANILLVAGYVSNARRLNKGGRRQAGFQPRSQLRAIQIATNQHEFALCLAFAPIFI
jgi:hypothetical protein